MPSLPSAARSVGHPTSSPDSDLDRGISLPGDKKGGLAGRSPAAAPLGQLNSLLFGHSLSQSVSQAVGRTKRQGGKRRVDHPRMCGPFVCSRRHTRAKSGPTEQSLPAHLLTRSPFLPVSPLSWSYAPRPRSSVLSPLPIWHIGFIVELLRPE